MKLDPYNHKERYFEWKKEVLEKGMEEVSKANAQIIFKYIQDMEYGLNVSLANKKGARSYHRLNTLREKMKFFSRHFKENFSLECITDVTEDELVIFFAKMRNGEILTQKGKAFKDTGYYVRTFKAFWHWWRIITCYTVMLSLIMGVGDMRSKLFNVETLKFIPRFLLFYIPSVLLLSQLLKIISPEGLIFGAIWELPKWLLFVHGFIIATIESTIWQGYLDHPESNVGQPWSSLIAGIFHIFVWKGTKIFIFISASLLFALFSFINWYFRKDKDDLAPAIGFHTAYNHLKMLSLV